MGTRVFFADDSRQPNPFRPGMGALVAVGGVHVDAERVGSSIRKIDAICGECGLTSSDEIKWSPGRGLAKMRAIVGDKREDLFIRVIGALREEGASVIVLVADERYKPVVQASSTAEGLVRLFIERAENTCARRKDTGFIIVDRPGGDGATDAEFLARCLDDFTRGTGHGRPRWLAHPVLTTSSETSRMLQVADLVTGATLAFVAGETKYSPRILTKLRPMFEKVRGRVGGVSIKLHPDYRYANLYHWLFGDRFLLKANRRLKLPTEQRRYATSAEQPTEIRSFDGD